MSQPIFNPQNPYIGVVRLFPHTLIRINGKPRPNAMRFAINLQTGPSVNPRDDLALHLSPCFTPPRIVRNSLVNGNWGVEEAWGDGSIINPYQQFEILILTEQDQYKIAINGTHFCEFRHRIPYQHVTNLTIDGDVDIHQIHITSPPDQPATTYQPQAPPQTNCPYPMNPTMPTPSLYPSVPVVAPSYPSAAATGYPPQVPSMIPGTAGPMPTPAYGGHQPYGPQIPGIPGPAPTPSYSSGYPPHPHQQHHGQSSGSSFLNTGLGALTGLGLGAAAGAAILSAVNPLKPIKKIIKPKFSSGWSRSSSDSSISSRGSFSSNSS